MFNKSSYFTLSLLFCFSLLMTDVITAQIGPPNNEEEFRKMYQRRIQREVLYGVYIPKDLADAFNQLNKKIDKESKQKFKNTPEEDASRKLHFSLGRWMIVNWSFYEGSRLSHYLRKLGASHPDDMVQLVIRTYHRYLNKKPLEVKSLVESYQKKRKDEILEKRKSAETISIEKKKREEIKK